MVIGLFILSFSNTIKVNALTQYPNQLKIGVNEGTYCGYLMDATDHNLTRTDFPSMNVDQDHEFFQTNVLGELTKIQYTSNATICYIDMYRQNSLLPIYDFTPVAFATNWLPVTVAAIIMEKTQRSLFTSILQFIAPSNVPLSDIVTQDLLDTSEYAELILWGLPYFSYYADFGSFSDNLGTLYSLNHTSTLHFLNPYTFTINTTLTPSFTWIGGTDLFNFNGTVQINNYIRLSSNGFLELHEDDYILNFTTCRNDDPMVGTHVNGTAGFRLERNYMKLASLSFSDYLTMYWYLWVIIIAGGGFALYFFTLKSQCKMESEDKANWTCKTTRKNMKPIN